MQNKGCIITKISPLIWLWLLALTTVIVVILGYSLRTKAEYGVVTGILYSIENSSAIVDGEIVREGDVIHGVEVVKIHMTTVEFEKNHNRWKQRVGGWPNRAWLEDD